MTVLNLTQPTRTSSGGSEERPILPNDNYRMKIIDSKIEPDQFDKEKDGTPRDKLVLTFEMADLTPQQQKAAKKAGQDWSEIRLWFRLNPFYDVVKAGGPSKFKEFLDNLIAWNVVQIDLTAFDPACLIGVELMCMVVKYTKTMGDNAGKPGNKIVSFAPIEAEDDADPF